MADASCSGGTPFKRLIDHQTRDTGLHQDRLTAGNPQSQSTFRSASRPDQGQEAFAAFADGASAGFMPHDAAGRLAAHAAALENPHHPIHHPSPFSMQPVQPAHRLAPDVSNWAADFSRFTAHQTPSPQPRPVQSHQPPQFHFQSAFQPQTSGFAPMYGPASGGSLAATTQRPGAEAEFDQEMSKWMELHGASAEAENVRAIEDIDAAMDQMARELDLNEAALPAESTFDNAHFTDLDTPEIGNLSLESRAAPEEAIAEQPHQPGRSAVSEAAERLLETVGHETGDKWQQSVFLSLMRDFRDGRKDIVGDEIRQTDGTETQ